ncbi:DgyrCDS7214 [Dimorphilus gyrociliatus]|uniref:DgyrCDS7214 n=1 Tax=Dimorphilus gyrociliatus TaxID=2664684 RepID=A0A7I8VRB6_9ANNE|nr:DgyrCDS7214 [Dimorphilus gyrociliatus]
MALECILPKHVVYEWNENRMKNVLFVRRLDKGVTEQTKPANLPKKSTQSFRSKQRPPPKTRNEVSVQDVDGDASTGQFEANKHLVPVLEDSVVDFTDAFDLKDEEGWGNVPMNHVLGRFAQYRQLAQEKIAELEDITETTIAKTNRKVQTLKAQFHDHKSKWEKERDVLIKRADQAVNLHSLAEKDADAAMDQLETFILQQETLEKDEEERKKDIDTKLSRQASAETSPRVEPMVEIPNVDEEKLLTQTDDAKVAEREILREESKIIEQQNDNSEEAEKSHSPPTTNQTTPTPVTMEKTKMSRKKTKSEIEGRRSRRERSELVIALKSLVTEDIKLSALCTLIDKVIEEAEIVGVHPKSVFTALAETDIPLQRITSSKQSLISKKTLSKTPSLEDAPRVKSGTEIELEKDITVASTQKLQSELSDVKEEKSSTIEEKKEEILLSPLSDSENNSDDETSSSSSNSSSQPEEVDDDSESSSSSDSKEEELYSRSDSGEDGPANLEELRANSAKARAVLRQHHKSALSERRSRTEGRRSKSPGIPTEIRNNSVLSSAELDENGDMPLPDEGKVEVITFDVGTSPLAASFSKDRTETFISSHSVELAHIREEEEEENEEEREDIMDWKQPPLFEHPIVQEYLKTYDTVIGFKQAVSSHFYDKEMPSLGQQLDDNKVLVFDKTTTVQPQIESMRESIGTILGFVLKIIGELTMTDQDYPVSSIGFISRDQTRSLTTRDRTMPMTAPPNTAPNSTPSEQVRNSSSDFQDLKSQYDKLRKAHEEEIKRNETQQHHQTVVMMEMQDTITNLRRDLAVATKTQGRINSGRKEESPPLMFTRLDAEQNTRVLKRALNERRLSEESVRSAVEKMESYVSVPAMRLSQLVRKYIHHVRMKQVEDRIRTRSRSINDNVRVALQRMEAFQAVRSERWAYKMDNLSEERVKLAYDLMDTLDEIENAAGVFLIKPFFSYRPVAQTASTVNAPKAIRHSQIEGRAKAWQTPAPTPASRQLQKKNTEESTRPASTGAIPIMSRLTVGTSAESNYWSPQAAVHKVGSFSDNLINTPRLLELDMNKMIYGHNEVAGSGSIRNYISVARSGQKYVPGETNHPATPPTTEKLTTPLPPISGATKSPPVPPKSPLGSSIYTGTTPVGQ